MVKKNEEGEYVTDFLHGSLSLKHLLSGYLQEKFAYLQSQKISIIYQDTDTKIKNLGLYSIATNKKFSAQMGGLWEMRLRNMCEKDLQWN